LKHARAQIRYKPGAMNDAPAMTDFRAPRWMRSGHLQTLGAALPIFSRPGDLVEERCWFDIPSGGALHGRASWHVGKTRPVVLVLHGVGGSSDSRSVVRGGRALFAAGFHVVRLDLRGAGEGLARAPGIYHAGLIEDPRVVVEALAKDPRVSRVTVLGISLGGHLTLKMMGQLGKDVPDALAAAVSISAPVDVGRTTVEIDRLRNLPYGSYVLRGLVKQAGDFAATHPDKTRFDPRVLKKLRKVREYHEHVIVPMHGFRDAEDYHVSQSAGPHLANVARPTLMIHAEDDPMVPLATVTPHARAASPNVELLVSASGGHVGWLGGLREEHWVNTWAIDRAIAFLRRYV
jgi:uncharacterized protein